MKEQTTLLPVQPWTGNGSENKNAADSTAVILAGGDNIRRRTITPAWLRGQRPTQFTRKPGGEFVINQTRKRVSLLFPPEKIKFVVTREHARYYNKVLKNVAPENLLVQPQDDGNLFAVLYSAMRLRQANPAAVLAFFPADFDAANARNVMRQVESAIAAVRFQPYLILFGTQPDGADSEREWIEPDSAGLINEPANAWRVRKLWLNPTENEARELMNQGALLNSSVVVGTAFTFIRKIREIAPDVYARFNEIAAKIGTPDEEKAVESAYYSNYIYTDFFEDVLAKSTKELAVIPVPIAKQAAVGINQPVFSMQPEKALKSRRSYSLAGAIV